MNKYNKQGAIVLFLAMVVLLSFSFVSAANFSLSKTEIQTKSYPAQSSLDVIAKRPDEYILTGKFGLGFTYNGVKKTPNYNQNIFNFYVEGRKLGSDGSLKDGISKTVGRVSDIDMLVSVPLSYVITGYGFQTKGSGKNYRVSYLEVYARKLTNNGLGSLETFKGGKKQGKKLDAGVLLDGAYVGTSIGGSSGKKLEKIEIKGSMMLMDGEAVHIDGPIIEVSDCQTLNEPHTKYILKEDVILKKINQVCFNIVADGITFDLNKHSITSKKPDYVYSSTYGIKVDAEEISIYNGNIENFDIAVYLDGSEGSKGKVGLNLVENLTFFSNHIGIYLICSPYGGGSIYGDSLIKNVFDEYSSTNSLQLSRCSNISVVGYEGGSISVRDSNKLLFDSASIFKNYARAISLFNVSSSRFSNLFLDASWSDGIYIESGDRNAFFNVDVTRAGSISGLFGTSVSELSGIRAISSNNNDFEKISLNDNLVYGLILQDSSNNTFYEVEASYNRGDTRDSSYPYGAGVLLKGNSDKNLFSNLVLKSNKQYGIYLPVNSSNVLVNIAAQNNTLGDVVYGF